jgi:hypothetical protein
MYANKSTLVLVIVVDVKKYPTYVHIIYFMPIAGRSTGSTPAIRRGRHMNKEWFRWALLNIVESNHVRFAQGL